MADDNLFQVKDLRSFLSWMDNLLNSRGNNTRMLGNVVAEFGVAYRRRSPSAEEELRHYLYHYGEIQEPKCLDLVARRGRIYVQNGSHEWIATALCILGISLKYFLGEGISPGEKIRGGFKIEDFLKEWPLDKQVAECTEFLKRERGEMREEHRRAYLEVLEGLCEKTGIKVEQSSGGDDGGGYLAVLYFLQGFYLDLMGFKGESSMGCYEEARRLEPDYYFWWHVSYLKGRTISRRYNYSSPGKIMEYALQAYRLAPREVTLRMGIGWVMAAVEHATIEGERFRNVESWNLLRHLLIGARGVGIEGSLLHRKWICLKLSELVIRFGTTEEEVGMGRELLEEMVRNWGECSLTLGAAAVLNYYGCLDGMLIDKEKGMELHEKAKQYYPGPLTKITDYFQFNVVKRKIGEIPSPPVPTNVEGVLRIKLEDEQPEKMQRLESWGKLNIQECGHECPPLWLASMIEKVFGQVSDSISAYLKDRVEKVDVSRPKTRRSGDLEATKLMVEWLCANIFVCSVYIHMKWEWKPGVTGVLTTDRNRKVLKEMERYVPERHHEAYQYLLQAMGVSLSLIRFQGLLRDQEQEDRVKNEKGRKLQLKVKRQASMWRKVEHSPVICFVKGKLAEMLGLEGDYALEQFRKAMELQPGYSLWQQTFQRKQMQIRASLTSLDLSGRACEDQATSRRMPPQIGLRSPRSPEASRYYKIPRMDEGNTLEEPRVGCGRGRGVRRIFF